MQRRVLGCVRAAALARTRLARRRNGASVTGRVEEGLAHQQAQPRQDERGLRTRTESASDNKSLGRSTHPLDDVVQRAFEWTVPQQERKVENCRRSSSQHSWPSAAAQARHYAPVTNWPRKGCTTGASAPERSGAVAALKAPSTANTPCASPHEALTSQKRRAAPGKYAPTHRWQPWQVCGTSQGAPNRAPEPPARGKCTRMTRQFADSVSVRVSQTILLRQ